MVMAMVCSPPERAFLYGGTADEREAELKESINAIATMRKVAMIADRHSEDSDQIGDCAKSQKPWTERHEKNCHDRKMHEQKRSAGEQILCGDSRK
jgi:hypothetical protein